VVNGFEFTADLWRYTGEAVNERIPRVSIA
jgi:hypothetical protein